MLEDIGQLKCEKAGLEAPLGQSQDDFYKLGYVDHLFGMTSDFEFVGRDFETFFISPKDLFAFTFEASIGEVVRDVGVQAGATGGEASDGTAAENIATAEGVATK
ncbi:hypothetical protein ACFX19_014710 [Malus domestica]